MFDVGGVVGKLISNKIDGLKTFPWNVGAGVSEKIRAERGKGDGKKDCLSLLGGDKVDLCKIQVAASARCSVLVIILCRIQVGAQDVCAGDHLCKIRYLKVR